MYLDISATKLRRKKSTYPSYKTKGGKQDLVYQTAYLYQQAAPEDLGTHCR